MGKIKDEKGEVTRSYDPAYMNTVACVISPLVYSFRSQEYLS